MATLKEKVISGVIWRFAERAGTQVVGLIVSIILARLLGPKAYGTIALLSIFIAVSGVFIDCGFGTALIRKKNATEKDFNSIFYLNICFSLIIYGVLFFSAPRIAKFYNEPILIPVLRVMALGMVISSFNGVQEAVLAREMLFKLRFKVGMFQTIVSGGVGISLAYGGFGIWALVWSGISGSIACAVILWILVGWRPKLLFAWSAVKELFNFSWKLMCSSVLDSFFSNLFGFIIGKVYTPQDLAYYNKGQQFPAIAMGTINGTLMTVAFPAFSLLQDDKFRLRNAMRKMIQCSLLPIMPGMVVLAVIAKPLVLILLGEKWLPSVPFLQLACFSYAFWPFHTVNLQAMNALGRSDVFLKLEIVKKICVIIALACSYRYGVIAMAFTSAFFLSPMSVLINTFPNRYMLNYGIGTQFKDIMPIVAISIILLAGLATVHYVLIPFVSPFFLLVLLSAAAIVIFYILLRIIKTEALSFYIMQFPILDKFFGCKTGNAN